MNTSVLKHIDNHGESACRSQLISLLVTDRSAVSFNDQVGTTVEDRTCANGVREICLYLGSHDCQKQSLCGISVELWAISDNDESDFAMWRLYTDDSEILLPLSHCPLCGLDLYGAVRHD